MQASQNDGPDRGCFRVRLSPTVLRQLGFVPSDVFRRIQRRLESLAELLEGSEKTPAESLGPSALGFERMRLCFTVDDYVAVFRLEEERSAITLLEVARRLPCADEG